MDVVDKIWIEYSIENILQKKVYLAYGEFENNLKWSM